MPNGPPFNKENLNEFKRGPLWKKCFLEAKETHPGILLGGKGPLLNSFKFSLFKGGTIRHYEKSVF